MAATTIEQRVSDAVLAWEEGQRRRRANGAIERAADGALACGGLILANAALPLGFALPSGRVGLSIGATLIGAGLAWIAHRRPRRTMVPQRAAEAWMTASNVRMLEARRAA